MGGIFGKAAKSSNQAYGQLSGALSPALGYATQGGNALMALLGGDSTGFDKYKEATGFDALAEQGSRGITGNAAARGLLRSGGTGKALEDYGNEMQNKYADTYLDKLLGLGNLGLGAGGVLAQAGQKSKGGKPGLGGAIGSIGAAVATKSDRRAKKDIVQVGELPSGLGLYQYNYLWDEADEPIRLGVMADEVEKFLPEALGPIIDGYRTVFYSKIEGIM